MTNWKKSFTKPTKATESLDFQVALRDVALKNHALTHLILWIEAHLRAETPHAEIRQGLEARLSAARPTGETRNTEEIWAGKVVPVDPETTRQVLAANGVDV